MKLTPKHDRIIVRPASRKDRTPGGIVLPEATKEKPIKGSVLAVGDGKLTTAGERVPCSVEAGDTVVFAKYSGQELEYDGETLLVIRDEDVLATVEE